MKTETVVLVAVLVVGGIVAFKLYTKAQTAAAAVPLGANIGTASLVGTAVGTVFNDIVGLFSGSNQDQQNLDNGYSYNA